MPQLITENPATAAFNAATKRRMDEQAAAQRMQVTQQSIEHKKVMNPLRSAQTAQTIMQNQAMNPLRQEQLGQQITQGGEKHDAAQRANAIRDGMKMIGSGMSSRGVQILRDAGMNITPQDEAAVRNANVRKQASELSGMIDTMVKGDPAAALAAWKQVESNLEAGRNPWTGVEATTLSPAQRGVAGSRGAKESANITEARQVAKWRHPGAEPTPQQYAGSYEDVRRRGSESGFSEVMGIMELMKGGAGRRTPITELRDQAIKFRSETQQLLRGQPQQTTPAPAGAPSPPPGFVIQ